MFKAFKEFKHTYLKRKSWEFSNKGDASELYIFDEISPFGMDENVFRDQLNAVNGDLTVYINSPGGDVFSGLTIANLLSNHDGTVSINVTGLAASIASVIAMAASPGRLSMSANALMMVHKPFSFVMGDANEMRKQANVLDKVEDNLINVYKGRTGLSKARIGELLNEETWLNAEEAVGLGFADSVGEAVDVEDHFNLSMFANAPKSYDQEPTNKRQLEAILRDAGLSSRQAKALISGGYAALSDNGQRDVDLTNSLKDLISTIKGA